jgi:hypothetical protein
VVKVHCRANGGQSGNTANTFFSAWPRGSGVTRLKDFATPAFVDLFCGIGGMRLAFERAGCRCVFSSDWDANAQKTYAANFGETPAGDLRSISSGEIPDHDILVAGFPCQPFSISGVSKKNSLGRAHGFQDRPFARE